MACGPEIPEAPGATWPRFIDKDQGLGLGWHCSHALITIGLPGAEGVESGAQYPGHTTDLFPMRVSVVGGPPLTFTVAATFAVIRNPLWKPRRLKPERKERLPARASAFVWYFLSCISKNFPIDFGVEHKALSLESKRLIAPSRLSRGIPWGNRPRGKVSTSG